MDADTFFDLIGRWNGLQRAIHSNSSAKGFWNPLSADCSSISSKIALCHSELSEALEEWRQPNPDTHKLGLELADVVIRCADIAEKLGFNLMGHVIEKHEKNLKRAVMHGGKRF